jgi:hypothetical protein
VTTIREAVFRRELLEQMETRFGLHHAGEERKESAQAKAERLLKAELARRGVRAEDLNRRRKGDKQKIKIAMRLRRETTMSWQWIADRLSMGTAGYAANCVRTNRKTK